MENIFSGVQLSDLTDTATGMLSALSPYVALLVGILLAFFVISFLVNMLKIKRTDPDDVDVPYDDDDFFDDDDDY
jgi:hypothetical protein